jgi:hypothetical protein
VGICTDGCPLLNTGIREIVDKCDEKMMGRLEDAHTLSKIKISHVSHESDA